MADVLSQNEIDSLLSAISSGELLPDEVQKNEENQKVKPYNFRNPNKFTKEHLKTLELIHDNYGRIISNYLTAQLRSNVKVKIESVQQITYEEFIHSIPNPTVLTIFKMPPLNGQVMFEMNPQFVFQIMDILLGGNGETQYETKEFTDIDKNLIMSINKDVIANLTLAWADILEVKPEIESIESNPALNQTMAPNEPVALITFSTEIGRSSSFMNICIPYLSIEKILDKLVVQYWSQEVNEDSLSESREKLQERLNAVYVNMQAQLGTTEITVDDFLKLSTGDIITLQDKSNSAVKVFIEGKPYFYAKPGSIGKNKGIQILDYINKDVDDYE